MKCPLQLEGSKPTGQANFDLRECVGEECAWWDTAFELCVIRSIARLMDGVLADLNQIRDKMLVAKK